MDQLFEFVGNHSLLVTIFLALAALLSYDLFGASLSGIQSVGPVAATGLINHDEAVVLDVREDAEIIDGLIINSIHIPLTKLESQINKLEKHKNSKIIISCRSGNRSATACKQLKKLGFENVYNLQGGVLAWTSANLPLSKMKK